MGSFLVTFTTFQKTWSPDHLRYGLFSNLVRAAHCDGAFLKYSLEDRFSADYATSCGEVCAQLAQSFGGPVKVAYKVNPMDHTQVIAFGSNMTNGVPTKVGSSASIFVSFRGTQGWDIINNRRNLYFVFWPVTLCAGCEAHKGFWRNFVSLRPEVASLIETLGGSISSIDASSTSFLTAGMSMGAPLASLTAYHLSNLGHTPTGVVTFGSPRVGNLKLAESIAGSFASDGGVGTIGIAYMRDPVTHVPPRVLGYRSAQSLLFHISIDPAAVVLSELGETVDLESYVRYSQAYSSTTSNGWKGDKLFAGSTYTFKLSDHLGYFVSMRVDMQSCGMMR